MNTKDITGQQRLSAVARGVDDVPGCPQRLGQRLFAKHMRACRESLKGHGGVMFGIGANRDGVRTQRRERLVVSIKARQTGKLEVEVMAIGRARRTEANELKTFDRAVGASVAGSHFAEPNHENTDGLRRRRR
ncbi:DNA-binding transcriptional regulator/RsmH inhibitor MraZ [Bradyrhizobium sp. GM24.11]